RRAAADARDWDVFRAALPGAKALTGAPAKPALDFLAGYAFGERAAAQARLVAAAAEFGPRFEEVRADLPDRARTPEADDAPVTFGALAGQQLGDLLREFTTGAEANPAEASALHTLRIVAKRLRYAIELFAECFPPALKATVYPAVERAQEILGDVQDATVGAERLAAIRATVKAAMPKQLTRARKGIDGLSAALRAQVPAGQKAFAAWRADWLKLMTGLKLELITAAL
ncbi:MAG: CHAD domain-containing protein, partial [Planctomycetes bacterium]|nr:CHAD domain-containing protein [Planctomycetota bacterium]